MSTRKSMSLMCLLHDHEFLSKSTVKWFPLVLLAIIICNMCMMTMYDHSIRNNAARSHNKLLQNVNRATIPVLAMYISQLLIQFYEKLVSFLWTSIEYLCIKYIISSLLQCNQSKISSTFDCTSQTYKTMTFTIASVMLFMYLNKIQENKNNGKQRFQIN